MKNLTIKAEITSLKYDELSKEEKLLVDAAKEATYNSYSPYSHFCVGAAIMLENGTVVKGANQENAAFSVTMCAERSAIFNAQSNYPQYAITQIAIAARNADGFISSPITPCGSCRQVILEMEYRYKREIKLYLYGNDDIYVVNTIKDILPLSFVDDSMH